MQPPRLIVLSAASGTGKTSLADALVERVPNLTHSISHTTRPKRPGEQHGVDYYFVSPSEFEAMATAGAFLEHATVFGNRYGTTRRFVDDMLASGKGVIFDIDWQGARAIKRAYPSAVTVFILPPSRAVLEKRLKDRGQDSPEVIARRMQAAVDEMSHYHEFEHVVVNDEFAEALADIEAIVRGNPKACRPLTVDINALLKA
ncbi:MAG: guanylate kinase [Gammaproteobacteria bacterium]|nr:guanylate kinase [Gammaproteobacteria bacterium]